MRAINVFRSLAILAIAAFGLAAPAEAAVTATLRAGNSCAGASSGSFSPSGPTFQVSLCLVATAGEGICNVGYRFKSANAGENGRFNLTARAMDPAYNFSNIAVVGFPIPIVFAPAGDLGAGTQTNAPVSSAATQLIATLDISPQATAMNASYVISLDAPFSNVTVDGGDGTCGGVIATTQPPITANFTLNLSQAPTIAVTAPPGGTVGVAYPGHTFTTTAGAPASSFNVTAGSLPPGLSLAMGTSGVLSGMPTTAGTFNFTVTASNGVLPNSSQAFSITIASGSQTITFAQPGGGTLAFSPTPFASNATASSGLVVSLVSNSPTFCTVSGLNITMVAAGMCSITASQAGNANFAAAMSVTQTFSITAVAPGPPTGVTSGSTGATTGSVSFLAPANTGGSPITGYAVTCAPAGGTDTNTGTTALSHSITGLTTGQLYTCSVIATNGAALSSVASATTTFTPVNIAPPVVSSANNATFTVGVAGTFNITSTGGPTPTITQAGALPTGVLFTSGGAGTGIGNIAGTPTQAGSFPMTITATNATGPTNNQAFTLTVNKGAQTITFNAQTTASRPFSAATFLITPVATASSGLAVNYTSTTPAICTVSGTTVTMVTVGNCTISANQPGDTNYNAATSVTQSVMITQAPQTITFGAQASRPFSATPFSLNPVATASSGLAVSYASSTLPVCTILGTSVTSVSVGICTITASQVGNANFSVAAPVPQSFNITLGTQTINFSTPPSQPINTPPFSLTSYATASSGLVITFTSQTAAVCTVAGSTVTLVTLGLCTIQAAQGGNANFGPAANATVSFTVVPPGAVTLSSSANPVNYGQSIRLTASVSGTNPTGTVTFTVGTSNGNITLCNAVTIVNAQATCDVAGNILVRSPVDFSASYSGDANNNPNTAPLQQLVNINSATLSAVASPLQIVGGRPVSLRAMLLARTPTGSVSFNENGTPLTGCSNVPVQLLPGATDVGVAACNVASISAGTHNYVVTYPHPSDAGFEQVVLAVTAAASGPIDYTDMWWAGTSENGWGMSITQHGLAQFVVFYVYDGSGKPIFYAMPGGTWNAAQTAFTGALYQPTSAPFSAYNAGNFNPGGDTNASVGTATVTYTGPGAATVTYTINGVSGTKSIVRQPFATDDGLPKLQIGDMWWGGPAQNGWGVNIAQQGRVLFPVWYTYNALGKATWYGVPGGVWTGTTYTGDIYTVTSSPWLGVNYVATQFSPVKVGTMVLTFVDQSNGTMTYTVNGLTQTKAITRQPY